MDCILAARNSRTVRYAKSNYEQSVNPAYYGSLKMYIQGLIPQNMIFNTYGEPVYAMFYKETLKGDERSPSSSDFKNWLDSNVYLKKPSNVYFLLYSPKWTNYHLLLELHLANHNQMLITPFLKLAQSHERHHSATYPVGEVYNRLESISYHKIFYKKNQKHKKWSEF